MIETYCKIAPSPDFERVTDFRPGSWVYVREATSEDLQKIADITKIDLADIRDSLDRYELPRIEAFDENTIVFLRHPGTSEQGLYTQTLTLILTPRLVIAVSPHQSDLIEHLLATNTQLASTQKAKIILHIILRIVQEFTSSIKRVRLSILGAEQPLKTIDTDSIMVLTRNEEILNQYLTSLVPIRSLLEIMESGRTIQFFEQDLDLLEDLMIAVRQSEDVCRVNIKSIRSLRDSYQIAFTNDVNRTIKILTAVTIIVTFPMIIASFYGMNVGLPFQDKPYAFGLLIGISILVAFIVILLFRKNRWL